MMNDWDERDRRAVRKHITQLRIKAALGIIVIIVCVALLLWLER